MWAKCTLELVLDWPHRLHLSLWEHDLQAAALWTSTPLVSCCAEHDPPLPVPSTGPGHTHQLRPLTSHQSRLRLTSLTSPGHAHRLWRLTSHQSRSCTPAVPHDLSHQSRSCTLAWLLTSLCILWRIGGTVTVHISLVLHLGCDYCHNWLFSSSLDTKPVKAEQKTD